jgi:hypothetical protein
MWVTTSVRDMKLLRGDEAAAGGEGRLRGLRRLQGRTGVGT